MIACMRPCTFKRIAAWTSISTQGDWIALAVIITTNHSQDASAWLMRF